MQAPPPPSPDPSWRLLLQQLVDRCVRHLDVEHASVAVVTGGRRWTPGPASSAIAAALDEQSFVLGEGPAHDAIRDHVVTAVRDLDSAAAQSRWPLWAGAALAAGIRSTTSLPMEAGAITAGVLVLHAAQPGRLSAADQLAASRFVDAGLLVLLEMATSVHNAAGSAVSDDLSVLLAADVHRAAGMVMVQARVPIDEALVRLRAHAFAAGRPLRNVAADVIARRLRFDAIGGSNP